MKSTDETVEFPLLEELKNTMHDKDG